MSPRSIILARLNGLVAALLAVLLAAQVATAFLPMAVSDTAGKSGITLVICTGDGVRTITLSEDGDAGDAPAGPMPDGHCPLCIVSADLPTDPFEAPGVRRVGAALTRAWSEAPQTLGQPRGRPDAIRAPPHTV